MLELFHKGGIFMYPLLAAFIGGVAVILERFWTLSRASVDTKKFLQRLEDVLRGEGLERALEVCSEARGPVAATLHAGLSRVGQGMRHVEKAIESAGSVEMAFLERGLVWLATVVNVAPMLGFLGTVSGMIKAFEAIARAGDVEPSLVAAGISEALITTAAGLSIAIPIQAFHNYFVSKIDKIVVDMEESSSVLLDLLYELGYGEEEGRVAAS
ncbi:MAG TPA: MotA/TolQ/ExbB proton channel family protein [Candidatus Latescibacteria bacterium]|nr:MotA/TolQ/ExbB proton channel family protein [Candidatus Latescibacterota bacterium]